MKQQFFHRMSLMSLFPLGLCKKITLEKIMDLSSNFLYRAWRNETHLDSSLSFGCVKENEYAQGITKNSPPLPLFCDCFTTSIRNRDSSLQRCAI
jgi:hypothetical protein